MTDLDKQISQYLQTLKTSVCSIDQLEKINEEFKELVASHPSNLNLLLFYNEFRVFFCDKLPKTRPQIIISGLINLNYPNIHSYPLFEVADVICLTATPQPLPYVSAIHCHPFSLFSDIMKKIPKGFNPDFFWDNQIEHQHFIPYGIEMAPFPIVASVCHSYLHKSVEQVCEIFDLILPISKTYGTILSHEYPEKIIEMPFGLNWGAFNHFYFPQWEKNIDVCISFDETNSPVYEDKRNHILKLIKNFKAKYGNRFNIKITGKLPLNEYMELLKQSRIVINATGINGPYNYRTVEVMCSGSLLFQYEWNDKFYNNQFSELFIDGIHGVSFNFDNLEQKLLHYLENPDITSKIAKEGYNFLIENYTYKKLYLNLIDTVKNRVGMSPKSRGETIKYYHHDMIKYYQNNHMIDNISLGILSDFKEQWIKLNNLLIFAAMFKENTLNYSLLISIVNPLQLTDLKKWTICSYLYDEALKLIPQRFKWLVQWNFLLISIENERLKIEDINSLKVLLNEEVTPFEDKEITFKYYVNSPRFPNYHFKKVHSEFINLNIELMKVSDNPLSKANVYRNYVIKALDYFLNILLI